MIEAALAYRIETELTKEEILEAYMNRIYFGSGYYGVETASQAYFGKPASLMNLPEAAHARRAHPKSESLFAV